MVASLSALSVALPGAATSARTTFADVLRTPGRTLAEGLGIGAVAGLRGVEEGRRHSPEARSELPPTASLVLEGRYYGQSEGADVRFCLNAAGEVAGPYP